MSRLGNVFALLTFGLAGAAFGPQVQAAPSADQIAACLLGLEASPPPSADVNLDARIDVADIIYQVNSSLAAGAALAAPITPTAPTLTIGTATVDPGGSASVPITLSGSSVCAGVCLAIRYDSTKASFAGVSAGPALPTFTLRCNVLVNVSGLLDEARILIYHDPTMTFPSSGTIFNLTFQASPSVQPGEIIPLQAWGPASSVSDFSGNSMYLTLAIEDGALTGSLPAELTVFTAQ